MITMSNVESALDRLTHLKTEKTPWLDMYQRVAYYVLTREANFTSIHSVPIFLDDIIFDNTAPNANHTMGSSLKGALWPNSGDTFDIVPSNDVLEVDDTQESDDYFQWCSKQVQNVFDDPRSGFNSAHGQYWIDEGSYGTAGIGVFETGDKARPVQFIAIDVKRSCIAEGADGFVDTVYIEKQFTVRQLIQEYGYDNVSKVQQDRFDARQFDTKVRVLHAIEPRSDRNIMSQGNRDMPIASIHAEVETKHELRNSGFSEMPIFVCRFWQVVGEVYGRSPATENMANILEINAMREAVILATEKMLDPPLQVNDESILGNGTVDATPGGLNVRRESGRINNGNRPAVEPIYTVGELNSSYKRLDTLERLIKEAFLNDPLLDLNNEQRQTLGEANIRDERQGRLLGTIFTQQISELYLPMIERVFRILFLAGLLGVQEGSMEYYRQKNAGLTPRVIPKAVWDAGQQGKDMFRVRFRSPAARIMKIERLNGLKNTVTNIVSIATETQNPEILDTIDFDEAAREMGELEGAPAKIFRSKDEIRRMRAQRSQAQQAQQQLGQAHAQAQIQKTQAQAAEYASKAGLKLA